MKIRSNFISNSSSASFIIPLSVLSTEQYNKLLQYNTNYDLDSWEIYELEDDISSDKFIKGWTIIDNGDMAEFLEGIGISSIYIQAT